MPADAGQTVPWCSASSGLQGLSCGMVVAVHKNTLQPGASKPTMSGNLGAPTSNKRHHAEIVETYCTVSLPDQEIAK